MVHGGRRTAEYTIVPETSAARPESRGSAGSHRVPSRASWRRRAIAESASRTTRFARAAVMKQAGAQVKQLHRDLAVMEVRAGIDEVRRHRCVVPVRGEDQGDSARDGHLGIISQPGRGESGPGRSGQVGFVDWDGRRGVK